MRLRRRVGVIGGLVVSPLLVLSAAPTVAQEIPTEGFCIPWHGMTCPDSGAAPAPLVEMPQWEWPQGTPPPAADGWAPPPGWEWPEGSPEEGSQWPQGPPPPPSDGWDPPPGWQWPQDTTPPPAEGWNPPPEWQVPGMTPAPAPAPAPMPSPAPAPAPAPPPAVEIPPPPAEAPPEGEPEAEEVPEEFAEGEEGEEGGTETAIFPGLGALRVSIVRDLPQVAVAFDAAPGARADSGGSIGSRADQTDRADAAKGDRVKPGQLARQQRGKSSAGLGLFVALLGAAVVAGGFLLVAVGRRRRDEVPAAASASPVEELS